MTGHAPLTEQELADAEKAVGAAKEAKSTAKGELAIAARGLKDDEAKALDVQAECNLR